MAIIAIFVAVSRTAVNSNRQVCVSLTAKTGVRIPRERQQFQCVSGDFAAAVRGVSNFSPTGGDAIRGDKAYARCWPPTASKPVQAQPYRGFESLPLRQFCRGQSSLPPSDLHKSPRTAGIPAKTSALRHFRRPAQLSLRGCLSPNLRTSGSQCGIHKQLITSCFSTLQRSALSRNFSE